MEDLSIKSRARGAMLGLAIGDALGAPYEFGYSSTMIREEMQKVRHFHQGLNAVKGVWTDDTSMALCLADSIIERGGYDSYDIMNKFVDWEFHGYRSYYGMGYGVGIQTDDAISNYLKNPIVAKDAKKTDSVGNGCIMRLAPVVIADIENTSDAVLGAAKLSCRETHDSIGAVAITELMAATLYLILHGESKECLLEKATKIVKRSESIEYLKSVEDSHKRVSEPKGTSLRDLGGFALDCYDIAMWGLLQFDNFNYGMLGVIGLGGDTDTNAAVYGQLAGAYYGYENISEEWRKEVYLGDEITELADKLAEIKSYKILKTRFEDESGFSKRDV